MGSLLLLLAVALVAAALVFGVVTLITGGDPALEAAEPDGRAVPLPGGRPLTEPDLNGVRFDTALRGYRMAQVDRALRRAAYDLGYKEELIGVLEAEVTALREGRIEEADALREARTRAQHAGAGLSGEDTSGTPIRSVNPAESQDDSAPGGTGDASAGTGAGEADDAVDSDRPNLDREAADLEIAEKADAQK